MNLLMGLKMKSSAGSKFGSPSPLRIMFEKHCGEEILLGWTLILLKSGRMQELSCLVSVVFLQGNCLNRRDGCSCC